MAAFILILLVLFLSWYVLTKLMARKMGTTIQKEVEKFRQNCQEEPSKNNEEESKHE